MTRGAYVDFTRPGKLLWAGDGAAGDQLGNGLQAAGDANHDDHGDLVVGAWQFSGRPAPAGRFIYSGRDGQLLNTLTDFAAYLGAY